MTTYLAGSVNEIGSRGAHRRKGCPTFHTWWYRRRVPDDDPNRRRLGDQTKARIADLASGWSIPPISGPSPSPPPPTPPPPLGVSQRPPASPPRRAQRVSDSPPPTPPPRAPGPPATGRVAANVVAGTIGEPETFRIGDGNDRAATRADTEIQLRADSSAVEILEERAVERDDPTTLDVRGRDSLRDASAAQQTVPVGVGWTGDATEIASPTSDPGAATAPVARSGRLRTVAALRRRRGVLGDVLYVATVALGVRGARRELARLETAQRRRHQERRKHLVILGRTAATSDAMAHPSLPTVRDQLATIEDGHARHRAHVGAADVELDRVKRERAEKASRHAAQLTTLDAAVIGLRATLEPLAQEHATVRRRAGDLRDQLRQLDAELADAAAALASPRSGKDDPAALRADLARRKADRAAVQRDEPGLAAQLDVLAPRIAALEGKLAEEEVRRAELVRADADDQRRTDDLLTAIGAKRKVLDGAADDAASERDRILFELGERLYVDRPAALVAQIAPIEAIDVDLGVGERRVMELREVLSTVDTRKLARGIAVVVLVLAAVVAACAWLVSR